jgi:hypothetical protein
MVPEPTKVKNQAMMDGLIYGGLVLAGMALLWAITMNASPDSD